MNDFIFKEFLHAIWWFDESLQLHLKEAGFPLMSRTKSLILLAISEGHERPNQIANKLGLTRQGVHLALGELEKIGLLSIEDDPKDKRAKRVRFCKENERDEMRRFAQDTLLKIEAVLASRVGERNFGIFRSVLSADWGAVVGPEVTRSSPGN
jgi:DNA-binding MarR family transcriptional regulator